MSSLIAENTPSIKAGAEVANVYDMTPLFDDSYAFFRIMFNPGASKPGDHKSTLVLNKSGAQAYGDRLRALAASPLDDASIAGKALAPSLKYNLLAEADDFGWNPVIGRPNLPVNHTVSFVGDMQQLDRNKPEWFGNIEMLEMITHRLENASRYFADIKDGFFSEGTWLNPGEREKTLTALDNIPNDFETVNGVWIRCGGDSKQLEQLWSGYTETVNAIRTELEAIPALENQRYGVDAYEDYFAKLEISTRPEEIFGWCQEQLGVVYGEMERIAALEGTNLADFLSNLSPLTPITKQEIYEIYAILSKNGLLSSIDFDKQVSVEDVPEGERVNIPIIAAAYAPFTEDGVSTIKVNPDADKTTTNLTSGPSVGAHEVTHSVGSVHAPQTILQPMSYLGPFEQVANEGQAVANEQLILALKEDVSNRDILGMLGQMAWRLSRFINEYRWHTSQDSAEEIIADHQRMSFINAETARSDMYRGMAKPMEIGKYILGYMGFCAAAEQFNGGDLLGMMSYSSKVADGYLAPHTLMVLAKAIENPGDFDWIPQTNFAVKISQQLRPVA